MVSKYQAVTVAVAALVFPVSTEAEPSVCFLLAATLQVLVLVLVLVLLVLVAQVHGTDGDVFLCNDRSFCRKGLFELNLTTGAS